MPESSTPMTTFLPARSRTSQGRPDLVGAQEVRSGGRERVGQTVPLDRHDARDPQDIAHAAGRNEHRGAAVHDVEGPQEPGPGTVRRIESAIEVILLVRNRRYDCTRFDLETQRLPVTPGLVARRPGIPPA